MSNQSSGARLTVEEEPKVELLKRREETSSYFLPFMKCVATCFICLVVLGCVVFSKISVIVVAEKLKPPSSGSNGKVFIMLTLILMVPQALSFIRSAWGSLRYKNRPWPTKRAIFVGVLGSILEVFGFCIFTMVTLSSKVKIANNENIALMNCVSMIPTFWHIWKLQKNNDSNRRSSARFKVLFFICGLVQLAGLVVIILKAKRPEKVENYSILSLLLISVAWSPKMRKWQIKPRLNPGEEPVLDDESLLHPGVALHRTTARTKATLISEGLKLLLTPFVGFFVCWIADLVDPSDLQTGFEKLGDEHDGPFKYFLVNIFISFGGYLFGILACSMAIQKASFALPLTLATPLSFTLITAHPVCSFLGSKCDNDWKEVYPIIICVLVWFAQFLSTTYYVWRSQDFIMPKESQLFWVPSYNGVLLEQNLLLNRKNELTDEYFVNQNKLAKDSCIFICTTMYHEADNEMEQLLYSLHKVDTARQASKRRIESHIWFDGAVKRDVLNSYVLQLISLVSKTMNVRINACMKLETPYGMELRWRLPGGMNFHIHLKDNLKVKNKKRWSQVMYMSYVLDFKTKQMNVREEDTYILTTDADIMFNAESVEALLDLMMRDPKVGAVCGRTHPLGNGPLVWYQTFDYAIGHWFQKVANHVLGSVLCCPGCFSVYRAKALRDVLPLYASTADHAVDFLTKDMGEDRWLCTLMVQAGWRLEYCAAAENSTFCPDNFDEFYKQRRRWVPSTLANLALLISEYKITVDNSDTVSFPFIFYQAANVFSTLISPATVILIIVGGLQYGWGLNATLVLVLLLIVTFFYGLVCLFTSQNVQLKTAKALTLVFAILMGAVLIGLAVQIAEKPTGKEEPTSKSTTRPGPTPTPVPKSTKRKPKPPLLPPKKVADFYQNLKQSGLSDVASSPTNSSSSTTSSPGDSDFLLGFAVSSWYFFGLVGVYILTALCHPTEAYCVLHGFCYLLCLPSGYLFLMIYSICNLTDRSWGTRENKPKSESDESLLKVIRDKLIWLCRGCKDPDPAPQPPVEPINGDEDSTNASSSSSSESDSRSLATAEKSEDLGSDYETAEEKISQGVQHTESEPTSLSSPNLASKMPIKSALKKRGTMRSPSPSVENNKKIFRFPGEKTVRFPAVLPTAKACTPISEWLEKKMKQYIPNFEQNGYDDTSFIAGMNEQDLKAIGIEKRGHRKNLLQQIEQFPVVELENNVPDNVEKWLSDLGLHEYWLNFKNNIYDNPKALEDLKVMKKGDLEVLIQQDLGVHKRGHLKKLTQAIARLQYPSAIERKIREARLAMNGVQVRSLAEDGDGVEYEFWTRLRETRLLPESRAFGQHSDLSEKLAELRDSVVLCFVVVNLLWIILIFTLSKKAELKVIHNNPLGLAFLVVFGVIIVVQFLTMLWHRLSTASLLLARAPFRRGATSFKVWSFKDGDLPPAPSEDELRRIRAKRLRHSRRHRSRELLLSQEEERPLINGGPGSSYLATSSRVNTLPV